MEKTSRTMSADETPMATPLFVDDAELCKLLGVRSRQTLAILEKRGLPPVDPVLGTRYFPAVRQFLDNFYGVGNAHAPCADGQENGWMARARKGIGPNG